MSGQEQNERQQLLALSKEELVDRLLKTSETPVASKSNTEAQKNKTENASSRKRKNKKARKFDFSLYNHRRIAVKVLYMGWDYHGLAAQDHIDSTIEAKVFHALTTSCLAESREKSKFSRCGRTDKGVSAFCQVLGMTVRSNLADCPGIIKATGDNIKTTDKELDYVAILNRLLPDDIRVWGWCPVDDEFDARFSCKSRMYKYMFAKGAMDIEKVKLAASKLCGQNDYRNFCKMDIANNVTNFQRKIYNFDIVPLPGNLGNGDDLFEFHIKGSAFLWHQVRCMVSVLFLVGHGREEPEIIDTLLNVENYPRKPVYEMGSEIPLVLFDCVYDNLNWIYDKESVENSMARLKQIWETHRIKAALLTSALNLMTSETGAEKSNAVQFASEAHGNKHGAHRYKKLVDRQHTGSLEERLASVSGAKLARLEKVKERVAFYSNSGQKRTSESHPDYLAHLEENKRKHKNDSDSNIDQTNSNESNSIDTSSSDNKRFKADEGKEEENKDVPEIRSCRPR